EMIGKLEQFAESVPTDQRRSVERSIAAIRERLDTEPRLAREVDEWLAARAGQRISPPIRLRTKRPTNGPARSVAIEPAAEVAALRIGFERDLRPVTAAAAMTAAEPI